MTRQDLIRAKNEATEFVHRALALLDATNPTDTIIYGNPKQRGALRRQSMELTRALADLRRS